MTQVCPLCATESSVFFESPNQLFFACPCCNLIFLHRNLLLNSVQEHERYNLHQNNSLDIGYQKFVQPIVTKIETLLLPMHKGLDFGSGKDSAISYMLTKKNYTILQYDPYYAPNSKLLSETYHYIACCEVIEHFYNPFKEFELLYSLLQPRGVLLCMTNLYKPTIDFNNWYYKNDPTHVSIFSEKTCHWIAQTFGFKKVEIENRLIIFSKY